MMSEQTKGKPLMLSIIGACILMAGIANVYGQSGGFSEFKDYVYPVGKLIPRDSVPMLNVGDSAPDFTLPAVYGSKVSLSQFKGKRNVVISFVPAAWTPVCSDQWPGYNIVKDLFDKHDAILLGISVDNIPTLYAWTKQMVTQNENLWFPVLSDFYPHGAVALKYGVLRSEGVTERAIFLINKKGIISYIDIHNINQRPPLEDLAKALEALDKQ